MEFNETYEYPADISRVWEMFSDQDYALERARELQMTSPSVEGSAKASEIKRVTTGGVPQDLLPNAAKRFIKPSAQVRISEVWRRSDSDQIVGQLQVVGDGIPASLKANVTLRGGESTTSASMSGDLSINIPFLGKRLEREAIGFAPQLAQAEVQIATKWLATH